MVQLKKGRCGDEERDAVVAHEFADGGDVEWGAGTIYAGVPAKKVKDMSPEMIHGEIDRIANNYVMYSSWFRDQK